MEGKLHFLNRTKILENRDLLNAYSQEYKFRYFMRKEFLSSIEFIGNYHGFEELDLNSIIYDTACDIKDLILFEGLNGENLEEFIRNNRNLSWFVYEDDENCSAGENLDIVMREPNTFTYFRNTYGMSPAILTSFLLNYYVKSFIEHHNFFWDRGEVGDVVNSKYIFFPGREAGMQVAKELDDDNTYNFLLAGKVIGFSRDKVFTEERSFKLDELFQQ